ncbi:hypothetical protein [Mycoplasma procyoni]|uniref:hypothetical protein n=1 Tax=Mycoplasma procyoni TaxID=568784 RepID=UPI00197BC13B|nr:hypothetical protein [Mycoplasma procyoni]MBN3534641.1 hypothetical protein [Mycoplasma procyoni]
MIINPNPLWFKQKRRKENYINVSAYNNIYKKNKIKDIKFFIQDREEYRTFYITNNINKQHYTKQYNFPEDIIFIPELKHELNKLDLVDKIYIHSYLLKFYATEKDVFEFYNYRDSLDFVCEQNQRDDWEVLLRRFKKRFPVFSKEFNTENLFKWASIIYREDTLIPSEYIKKW